MRAACFLLLSVMTTAANKPVAFAAGCGPIVINGIDYATPGVLSWPVVSGDVIETIDISVIVVLAGPDRVLVEPHTRVKIVQQKSKIDVVLLSGKIRRPPFPDLALNAKILDRRLPYRLGFTGNR